MSSAKTAATLSRLGQKVQGITRSRGAKRGMRMSMTANRFARFGKGRTDERSVYQRASH